MKEKTKRGTRAIISAKYLPILDAFRAKAGEVRYYLSGIQIEPHEEAGAYLVATDGHRMVVVHDADAKLDGLMLVNPEKVLIRESKGAHLADFDGKTCDLQNYEEEFLVRGKAPIIDGRYPDWESVIPAEEIVCEVGNINPEYIVGIMKAPFNGMYKSACFYTRKDKVSLIRFPTMPEILVLIMPLMNQTAMPIRPEWLLKKPKPPEGQSP